MFKKITATTLTVLASSQAVAHVGDHSENSVMSMVGHFFSEPDHLLISAVVAGAVWFAVSKMKKAKSQG